jgi:hypothetical protein
MLKKKLSISHKLKQDTESGRLENQPFCSSALFEKISTYIENCTGTTLFEKEVDFSRDINCKFDNDDSVRVKSQDVLLTDKCLVSNDSYHIQFLADGHANKGAELNMITIIRH